jgi:tetratricopeptide (TPR) repeat protein
MLFDLRGRGRRRTVQAIYLTLAVLMGGGLVLFGIGGSVSGGLFDAIGLTGGSGSGSSANEQLAKQEKAALARTRANPNDAAAWVTVTRLRYQQAGQGDNFDQGAGTFKSGGRKELRKAAQAWSRYLALNPDKPDANVASLMVQAFSPLGLNQPQQGVEAAEIVADTRPSAQTYYQLAVFAFAAKQTRKAELAGTKAVELAPKDQRAAVKSQVDQARSNGGFPSATGQ